MLASSVNRPRNVRRFSSADSTSAARCSTSTARPRETSPSTGSNSKAPMPRLPTWQSISTASNCSADRLRALSQTSMRSLPKRSGNESASSPGNPRKVSPTRSENSKTPGCRGIVNWCRVPSRAHEFRGEFESCRTVPTGCGDRPNRASPELDRSRGHGWLPAPARLPRLRRRSASCSNSMGLGPRAGTS